MSEKRTPDIFAAVILVASIVGIILVATQWFASLWSGAYYYHSCLDCAYATGGDLAAQIIILILLIVQIIVALNDLLPKRFIQRDLFIYGMGLAGLTVLMTIIGLISFGVVYEAFEWWPDTGFYGAIIVGIINTVLFYLKYRNR
ncbi:MAG: hypothetical protein ACFE9X_16415 [Promethearchaeota archaeon]